MKKLLYKFCVYIYKEWERDKFIFFVNSFLLLCLLAGAGFLAWAIFTGIYFILTHHLIATLFVTGGVCLAISVFIGILKTGKKLSS